VRRWTSPNIFIFLWKVFRIGTVRYNWPMSAHASQAFSIAHCTDSEDLPGVCLKTADHAMQCNDDHRRRREPLCQHELNKQLCTADHRRSSIERGKSSESVQCAMLKACDAFTDSEDFPDPVYATLKTSIIAQLTSIYYC